MHHLVNKKSVDNNTGHGTNVKIVIPVVLTGTSTFLVTLLSCWMKV